MHSHTYFQHVIALFMSLLTSYFENTFKMFGWHKKTVGVNPNRAEIENVQNTLGTSKL